MKTAKPFLIIAVHFLLMNQLLSCGGGGGPSGGGDSALSVTIIPNSISLQINETQTFNATVSESSDQGVSWSVEEGSSGGSINQNGTYTAPGSPGTYHVIATSMADTTKNAVSTVTVSML